MTTLDLVAPAPLLETRTSHTPDAPTLLVGVLGLWRDQLLLVAESAAGPWRVPAGLVRAREAAPASAQRLVREVGGANVAIDRLLAVYSSPKTNQIEIVYRARLLSQAVSDRARLFAWAELPWGHLAEPWMRWALAHFGDVRSRMDFAAFSNPPGETG